MNEPSTKNSYQLMGEVTDENGKPIEVGNVILLNPIDSSLIYGDLFLDGSFSIKDLSTEIFLLQVTALGFEDYYQVITSVEEKAYLDLGRIMLRTQVLVGVEVTVRQALFAQKGDDLVINVANTSLQNSGTAMDVLRNSPKVLVNSSGQISVLGKGNALIYVNGQRIASDQILHSLSSNDLKEVAIIENPSAQYDAAGNAVINIITKSRNMEGFKIGLLQEVGHGKHFRSYFQANAYYKINKFLFQTSYGIRPWTRGGREHYFRTYERDGILTEVDNKNKYDREVLNHDVSFKTVYELSAKQKLGVQYSGIWGHWEKDGNNRNLFYENGEEKFTMNTVGNGPFDRNSHILSAFYEHQLDTLGSLFSISGQYSNFNLERLEHIDLFFEQENMLTVFERETFNTNDIDIYSVQADWQKSFTTDLAWTSGLKNAYITNESLLDFRIGDDMGELVRAAEFSDDYDYQENILAAYTQLTWTKNSLKTNIGLRTEWTTTEGQTGTDSQQLFSRNYLDVFPSVAMTKNFDNGASLNFSYGYRLQRPQFQDLNPFIYYVDSLVSLQGNPNLIPEYSHALSGSFSHQKWTLNLNYTYTKDKINTIIQVQDFEQPDVFAFLRDNIESTKLYAASLSYPIATKWYYAYFMLGGRYESHRVQDVNNVLVNEKAGYYFYTNQSVQLPWDLKLEATFQYTSPRVDGIYVDNPIWYLNMAITRKFFGQHLTARIWANDIFDKYKFTGISNFNNSHFRYLSEGDMSFIKLVLNWDFGKLGIGRFQERKIAKSELMRINQG